MGNVKKTQEVLNGILNYARVEAKETMFSEFPVQEVVDLSLDLLKMKHGIDDFPLEVIKESSDVIYAIKSQMMDAVYNLLDNGYEAALDKVNKLSKVEVAEYQPKLQLKISQTADKSVLQFTDNGIGIKEADRHKIFAPFFTTKASSKSGAGIGMYVVKRMIEENHKGRISFVSEYGKGTRISVELPKKLASY
jgi:signal transduction histidine kinase